MVDQTMLAASAVANVGTHCTVVIPDTSVYVQDSVAGDNLGLFPDEALQTGCGEYSITAVSVDAARTITVSA